MFQKPTIPTGFALLAPICPLTNLTDMIKQVHHLSIIVSSEEGIEFYKVLGFLEQRRIHRGYDQIVWMSGYGETLEIFIDANHPARVTNPEALGLRHLAFEVDDIDGEWARLAEYHPEPMRLYDNGQKMFFVKDPDGTPIEFRN